MSPPASAIGRVAALPASPGGQFAVAWRDRIWLGECAPSCLTDLKSLAEGDLVRFTWTAPGRFTQLDRIPATHTPAPAEEADAWRWRRLGAERSRMRILAFRHRVLRAIREFFDAQGFVEIDTPVLVPAPSPEPQFAPFATGRDFLITSPEFQLKRLLVGGFERIYRLGPVFRSGEVGRLHNPEYTLLEWYRTDADLNHMAGDLEGLLTAVLPLAESLDAEGRLVVPTDAFHAGELEAASVHCDTPFPRRSVAALFREHLGFDIAGLADADALRHAAAAARLADADAIQGDFEQVFFALWNRFEHRLGRDAPLLVTEWPAPLASLARLKADDPTVAERMEWIVAGIEIANGFAELTDAEEQRRRFERDRAMRRERGMPDVPLDEKFLRALAEGMPPAAGMALGADRLVMLLAGASSIGEVLPFTWAER